MCSSVYADSIYVCLCVIRQETDQHTAVGVLLAMLVIFSLTMWALCSDSQNRKAS